MCEGQGSCIFVRHLLLLSPPSFRFSEWNGQKRTRKKKKTRKMSNDREERRPPRKPQETANEQNNHKPSPRKRNKQNQNPKHTETGGERRQREMEKGKILENQGLQFYICLGDTHTEGQVEKAKKERNTEVDKGLGCCGGWWLPLLLLFFASFFLSLLLLLVACAAVFCFRLLCPLSCGCCCFCVTSSLALFLRPLSFSLYFSYSFLGSLLVGVTWSLLLRGVRFSCVLLLPFAPINFVFLSFFFSLLSFSFFL